jgi:hypothetical protein
MQDEEAERFNPRVHPVEPGMLDVRVFDQDQVWVDVNGRAHDLTSMSFDYLVNVNAHAERFAPTLYARHLFARPVDVVTPRPAGSAPLPDPAWQWVQSTPLVRRLLELIVLATEHPQPRPPSSDPR